MDKESSKRRKAKLIILLIIFFIFLLLCCVSVLISIRSRVTIPQVEPETTVPAEVPAEPEKEEIVVEPVPEPIPEPTPTPTPAPKPTPAPAPAPEPYCSAHNVQTYWGRVLAAPFTWMSFTTNGFPPYSIQGDAGPGNCYVRIAEPKDCTIAGYLTGGNTVMLVSNGEYLATDPSFGCNATKN